MKRFSYIFAGLLLALPVAVAQAEDDDPVTMTVGGEGEVAGAVEEFSTGEGEGAVELTTEALEGAGVGDLETEFTESEYERISDLPVPSPVPSEGEGDEEALEEGDEEAAEMEMEGDGAEVILGPDTRERLYTRYYPARARVLVTFSGGRCSGALIGPNTVATAGHCIHTGGSKGRWRRNVRVYPGANGRSKPYGSCAARSLHSVKGWTNGRKEQYDYGAIKLGSCKIGNRVGWFGFTTAGPGGLPALVGGYPGDKPLTQWQGMDDVDAVSRRQVFYHADTTGGMSGSGVWYDRRGPYLIGIHAYGTHGSGNHRRYNHGVRITRAVFNNLRRWKNLP